MPLRQTMHFRAPTGNRKLALSSGPRGYRK